MFLVKDSLNERQIKIRSFLETDPAIAVLLAAADFEWCVNRFIVALGNAPNTHIRDEVLSQKNNRGHRSYVSGLSKYKDAWNKVRNEMDPLDEIIGPTQWDQLKLAFNKRHALIHGRQGTTGRKFSDSIVANILACSEKLNEVATDRQAPLYGKRIVVKRKSRG